ncbi:hypothetical protein [Mycobacteroides abscessus]|uniref:hypothetical protein n=1 Tax=Mycobacteroides abscessus TaxID=36809 RepID=UPI000AB41581|nr:hypothetical protein [Mycobacteroides abscessus]
MARDHTRINLDIWGDDEFRDLPVDAQNLYWTLWTSPNRTYCGAHEWRPGKLTQTAGDWTVPRILAAGAVLSKRLFLIVDDITEECLLRSWIKHDGLWKIPNMAVTMANARAALGSKTLRGVIVHEVKKLVKLEPALNSWTRNEVVSLLSQKAIDPATIQPFTPPPTPPVTPPPTQRSTPDLTLNPNPGDNPPPNPAPTTATASSTTATASKEGYVSQVSHLEPPSRCPAHIDNLNPPKCGDCADARRLHQKWETEQKRIEASDRAARRRAIDECPDCDCNGLVELAEDLMTECVHPSLPHLHLVHDATNQRRSAS